MKTYNNLFTKISSFENLYSAARLAEKGKKKRNSIARFNQNLDEELSKLREELVLQQYQPGPYRSFYIHDPKKRMISAAPYRDRVIHHALCNITAPIFEKTFIYDSYANRVGKGVHTAIERYQQYAKIYPYVLKCDIRKFFPSIDHEILKKQFRKKIICKPTLWLMDLIVDNSNPQEAHDIYFPGDTLFAPFERRKGLPIGNLTSQWWGNLYLNGLDHYIKEELGVPGYIRYVDDFVLFAKEKETLWDNINAIQQFLNGFRLVLHPNKTQIYKAIDGVPFLGYQVFPHHRYVKKAMVKRFRRFIKKKLQYKAQGKISVERFELGLNSWLGHIRFGQHKRTEYKIFWYLRDRGVNLFPHPSGSWRVLEYQPSRK